MKTKEQKVIDREDALLKREGSIRFDRTATIVFAAVTFFWFIVLSVYVSELSVAEDTASIFVVSTDAGTKDFKVPAFLMFAFFYWASLATKYNLMSHHIDSIKMYRSKLKVQWETENPQPSP